MKGAIDFTLEVAKIVILSLAIVLPIRYFVVQPFFVQGASMEPNFQNGDYLLIDELSYRSRQPQRGEVVVFRSPPAPSVYYIKRIVGLPGETVQIRDGGVYITSRDGLDTFRLEEDYLYLSAIVGSMTVRLGDKEVFVLGDNRSASYDSRQWGPLPLSDIIGRAWIRAFPFGKAQIFNERVFAPK